VNWGELLGVRQELGEDKREGKSKKKQKKTSCYSEMQALIPTLIYNNFSGSRQVELLSDDATGGRRNPGSGINFTECFFGHCS